jgi:hypothetical protein
MSHSENIRVGSWSDLLESISEWEVYVREEMKAAPLAREIDRNARELEKLLESYATLDESYFTREEAADLAQRLDELERRMAEQIRLATDNEKDQKSKITDLHADIQGLKENLATHNKRGWVGKALVRVNSWLKDPGNQTLLKSGAEVAKILLPPGSGA